VTKHKLSWYNPDETIKGQHTQATACFALIYDNAVRPSAVESQSAIAAQAYIRSASNAKTHFRASAAFAALSAEQLKEQVTPNDAVDSAAKIRSKRRDAWVYDTDDANRT
jgi:hypothetical protein